MAAKDTQGKTVFWRIAALLMLAAGIAAGWTLRGCGSGASGVMSPDTVTDTVRVADSVEVVVPITQRVYMKRWIARYWQECCGEGVRELCLQAGVIYVDQFITNRKQEGALHG